MLSFFKKKAAKSEEAANGKTMKAYLTGKVIPIEEVNDGVFSAKIMGDGIAIIPENEVLTAPADGEITVVMDGSFHAVGMRLCKMLFDLAYYLTCYLVSFNAHCKQNALDIKVRIE